MMYGKNNDIKMERYSPAFDSLLQIPKYKPLDHTAVLVYGKLVRLLMNSKRNGWCNEEGSYYCKASVRTLAEELNSTPSTMSRKLSDLESAGLIVRKKMGWHHTDLIFVNEPDYPDDCSNGGTEDSFFCNANVSSELQKEGVASHGCTHNKQHNKQENSYVKQQHTDSTTLYRNIECATENTDDVNVVVKLLENFGVTAGAVRKLIHQYPIVRINEVVQAVKKRASAVRNAAGYICSALKNNYQFPKQEEKTSSTIQIVVENAAEVVVTEDTSNHITEPAMTPCEASTEKYAVQARPAVDTESPERVKAMKDWISRIYKERGSIVKPLQNWLDEHGFSLNSAGDVVPAV